MEWNKGNMRQCHINFNDLINLIKKYNYIPLMIIGEELFLIPKEKIHIFKHLKKPLHNSVIDNQFFNWIENFNDL